MARPDEGKIKKPSNLSCDAKTLADCGNPEDGYCICIAYCNRYAEWTKKEAGRDG